MEFHPKHVSTPSDYSAQIKAFQMERRTYFMTLLSISIALLALGIVANIIVCCGLSRCRISRSTTKLSLFFILQLAITDLVYRAVTVILTATDKKEDLSPEHCKLAIFSQFSCAAVLFVLLTAIAIDRYVHILYPLQSLTINTRKYLIMFFISLYSMLICSGFIASAAPASRIFRRKFRQPTFYPPRNVTTNDTSIFNYEAIKTHCVPGISASLERKVAFTIYFVFAFLMPLLMIILVYTRITVFLWKRAKTDNSVNRITAKAKLRAIHMFIMVVFSFLISWGPIMILDMLDSYPITKGEITLNKFPLRPVFVCISQTSSIFNPFIYAFGDANFRRSLRLCCRRTKGSRKITRVSPGIVNVSYIQMRNQLRPKELNSPNKLHYSFSV